MDEDGKWRYEPEPGFTGKDEFTIIVKNKDGDEEEILIEIEVEKLPGGGIKVLPKTGEQDSALPQWLGMLLIAAGLLIRRRKAA